MPIAFYMDQHVPRAVAAGLRLRGVEVLTAYEDGTSELGDEQLLDRAGEVGRVLFTRDDDLLAEATKRHRAGIPFYGIVYAHQLRVLIGRCVEDLELIAKAGEPVDLMNPGRLLTVWEVRKAAPANMALHRIAARWRFCLKPNGFGWAARGELRRWAAEERGKAYLVACRSCEAESTP